VSNLRIRIGQNVGLWLAVALFLLLYSLYNGLHPKGFSVDLLVQNSRSSRAGSIWRPARR